MLVVVCLWWIGMQLQAPNWYFWSLGITVFVKVLNFLMDIYKLGKESK